MRLPFIGSQEDGEPFQYMLTSIEEGVIEISIPVWLVRRSKLNLGERVDLYLPRLRHVAAKVASENGENYRIKFDENMEQIPNLDEIFSSEPEMMDSLPQAATKLIKDSMLLKSGIRVYLKHLIPYFARIVDYSAADYLSIKRAFLKDVLKRVVENETKLQNIYEILEDKLKCAEEIPVYIDLEAIREVIESEISLPLFNLAFSEQDHVILDQFKIHIQYGYTKYIKAVKQLEKRQYSNYNRLVVIYLSSFWNSSTRF